MAPRSLLAWGIVLAVLSLVLAGVGRTLRGPANPECAGLSAFACGGAYLTGALVQLLALPVAIAAGSLVAIWLGRREQAREEA